MIYGLFWLMNGEIISYIVLWTKSDTFMYVCYWELANICTIENAIIYSQHQTPCSSQQTLIYYTITINSFSSLTLLVSLITLVIQSFYKIIDLQRDTQDVNIDMRILWLSFIRNIEGHDLVIWQAGHAFFDVSVTS